MVGQKTSKRSRGIDPSFQWTTLKIIGHSPAGHFCLSFHRVAFLLFWMP